MSLWALACDITRAAGLTCSCSELKPSKLQRMIFHSSFPFPRCYSRTLPYSTLLIADGCLATSHANAQITPWDRLALGHLPKTRLSIMFPNKNIISTQRPRGNTRNTHKEGSLSIYAPFSPDTDPHIGDPPFVLSYQNPRCPYSDSVRWMTQDPRMTLSSKRH